MATCLKIAASCHKKQEVSLQIKMDNLKIMGQKIQTKAKMTQLQQQRKSFSTLIWVAQCALEIENSTIVCITIYRFDIKSSSFLVKDTWHFRLSLHTPTLTRTSTTNSSVVPPLPKNCTFLTFFRVHCVSIYASTNQHEVWKCFEDVFYRLLIILFPLWLRPGFFAAPFFCNLTPS